MGKKFQGKMLAEGKRFAIVVSRFNEFITRKLLEGAEDSLIRHGADQEDIDVFCAPGSFEIPQVTKRVAQLKGGKKIRCHRMSGRNHPGRYPALRVHRRRGHEGDCAGIP